MEVKDLTGAVSCVHECYTSELLSDVSFDCICLLHVYSVLYIYLVKRRSLNNSHTYY